MGVKSTVRLTRTEAEQRYVNFRVRKHVRSFRAEAVALEDEELEDKLEEWNDAAADGQGYENYIIVDGD